MYLLIDESGNPSEFDGELTGAMKAAVKDGILSIFKIKGQNFQEFDGSNWNAVSDTDEEIWEDEEKDDDEDDDEEVEK